MRARRWTDSEITTQSRPKGVSGQNRALGPLALVGAVGLVLAGCGDTASSKKSRPAAAAPVSGASVASSRVGVARVSASRAGAMVKVMRTRYGRVLVDGGGRALYLFTRDRTPSS